jgi:hypothetical protein
MKNRRHWFQRTPARTSETNQDLETTRRNRSRAGERSHGVRSQRMAEAGRLLYTSG